MELEVSVGDVLEILKEIQEQLHGKLDKGETRKVRKLVEELITMLEKGSEDNKKDVVTRRFLLQILATVFGALPSIAKSFHDLQK